MHEFVNKPSATADPRDLLRAVRLAKASCDPRSAVKALGGVLIDVDGDDPGGTAECSNLSSTTRAPFVAAGRVRALVEHKTLVGILNGMTERVEFAVDKKDDVLVVTHGRVNMRLPLLQSEDFPETSFTAGAEVLDIDGPTFDETVRAVTTFASKDETLPALTGVLLSQGQVVATDSYRLLVREMPGLKRSEPIILVGYRLAAAVKGAKRVTIHETKDGMGGMIVDAGDRVTRLPVIDGQYPNWKQLIPGSFGGYIDVDRKQFLEVTKAAAKTATLNRPLKMRLVDDGLELSIDAYDSTPGMSGVVDVDDRSTAGVLKDGWNHTPENRAQPFEIGLNPQFLHEGALALDAEEMIRIKVSTPLRPALLTDLSEARDRYLIMPIQLNV
jgi:DNA polymerase-3 subunit beta